MPHLTIAANVATVPKLLGWEQGAGHARGCASCWT